MGAYDLIVIGGGPAGTTAAITAARGGARVLLLERGSFPRQKVCGEFVSAESLDLLRGLLDAEHAEVLCNAVKIPQARIFIDGRVLRTAVDPPAASIARLELDAALWECAIRNGVEARPQTTVQSVSGNGPFKVETSAGSFDTRAVVDASGRWSNLNAGGAESDMSPQAKWIGLKSHFRESYSCNSVDLYFFPRGYCGVQPVAVKNCAVSRVNVCAMVQARRATTLPEVFALHPELEERSHAWQPIADTVTTSPLLFRKPQTERNKVLLAGDAAGFVDPFVGDGISLALRSGSLVARCLLPFFDGQTAFREAAQQYGKIYQEQLSPVFQSSSRIRWMLLLPPSVRAPFLAVLEKVPAITRYLVRNTR